MGPEISIVIPVYNSEATVAQAIRSVQEQEGLPSLEVICVDDGSTDGSLQTLEQLARDDPRITVLTQQNQFAGAARNHGMDRAGGKYLAFLDADDRYLPGALSSLYKLAQRDQLDLVKGGFCCVDAKTGEVTRPLYARNVCVEWPRRGRVLRFEQLPHRLVNVSDVPWNGLYRRDFLERHRIRFNGLRCVNDHSFYIDCLIHAQRMMVVNTEVACYRIGQEGSLIGKKPQYFSCCLDSYRIVRGLCRGISPKLRRIILRQELTGVFAWYERLRSQAEAPDTLEEALRCFLRSYDEGDVGEQFLWSFPFGALYYRLRYNAPPPRDRPPLPARAFQCWREHGWQYTLAQLTQKGAIK